VHVASVRRAITLVYKGLAQFVAPEDFGAYDFEAWRELSRSWTNGAVRSVDFQLRVPDVIRLRFFNGRASRKIRFSRSNIFERDDYTCQYCGRRLPPSELTLDHIVPRSRGGRSTWRNLVVACIRCNDHKSNRLLQEAGMTLLREPRKPKWSSYFTVRTGRTTRESWRRFVDAGGWDSELQR
jgi:5-methylcytosine-specific restriction endonuclease McrA